MVVPNGLHGDTPSPAVKIDEPFDLLASRPTCHLAEVAIMAEAAAAEKGECGSRIGLYQFFPVIIHKMRKSQETSHSFMCFKLGNIR